VNFQLTGAKSYGDQGVSLDEAKALFKAESQPPIALAWPGMLDRRAVR
jgi:hypothetical protein